MHSLLDKSEAELEAESEAESEAELEVSFYSCFFNYLRSIIKNQSVFDWI